jgi:hypothetical protein
MAPNAIFMHAILAEQTAKTSRSSTMQIKQLIEESNFKINSFESQIAVLIELRDRERAAVAALQYLITPIHTLPVEVLSDIFVLTVFNGPNEIYSGSSYVKDALRVFHVCSDWRQVAHCTPRLWSRAEINLSQRGRRSQDTDVEGMRAWLIRSAPLPISVSFKGLNQDVEISPGVEEVMVVSPRWRSLRVWDPAPPSFFRRLTQHALNNLEEVDLEHNDGIYLGPTPRLRKVTLNSSLRVYMPWAQLTDLTMTRVGTPDIFLDILALCTNLVTASVCTVGWTSLHPARPNVFTLQHLRTLVLSFFSVTNDVETHFIPFLVRLFAPALQEIHLHLGSTFAWIQPQFTAFQLRSPRITHLDIGNSRLTSDDLGAVLSLAPSLTHLVLHHCPRCIDHALLCALYYKDGVTPLVPRLHDLTILGISDYLSEDVLAGMIASRWWTELASNSAPPTVARWRYIKLQSTSGLSKHFVDMMEGLAREGLLWSP